MPVKLSVVDELGFRLRPVMPSKWRERLTVQRIHVIRPQYVAQDMSILCHGFGSQRILVIFLLLVRHFRFRHPWRTHIFESDHATSLWMMCSRLWCVAIKSITTCSHVYICSDCRHAEITRRKPPRSTWYNAHISVSFYTHTLMLVEFGRR